MGLDTPAAVLAVLEGDPMGIEVIEAAIKTSMQFSDEQVLAALRAFAGATTSAEIWCRVGMLRAARYLVRRLPSLSGAAWEQPLALCP